MCLLGWVTQRSRSTWPQGQPSWKWRFGGGVGVFILQLLRSKVETNQNIMEYMTHCTERCTWMHWDAIYPLRHRNSFLKIATKTREDVQHHFPLQTSPITNNSSVIRHVMLEKVPQVPPQGWIRGWKPYLRWQKVEDWFMEMDGNGIGFCSFEGWYQLCRLYVSWMVCMKSLMIHVWGAQTLRKLPCAWKTWQFLDYGMPRNHRFNKCAFPSIPCNTFGRSLLWALPIPMKKVRAESTLTHFPIRATSLAQKKAWSLENEKASCQKYQWS